MGRDKQYKSEQNKPDIDQDETKAVHEEDDLTLPRLEERISSCTVQDFEKLSYLAMRYVQDFLSKNEKTSTEKAYKIVTMFYDQVWKYIKQGQEMYGQLEIWAGFLHQSLIRKYAFE